MTESSVDTDVPPLAGTCSAWDGIYFLVLIFNGSQARDRLVR